MYGIYFLHPFLPEMRHNNRDLDEGALPKGIDAKNGADPIGDLDLVKEVKAMYERADPAHDFSHIMRVYKNAKYIGEREGADMQVLLMAALLHDVGSELKGTKASAESNHARLKIAEKFLAKKGFSEELRTKILYAVDVHRFSRGIYPETLEAKVLQDADRLDAIGAVGIARVFMVGGSLGREFYDPGDPFSTSRDPDDSRWNLDHFFSKLLKLESGMHTDTAKALAESRGEVLRRYISDLKKEIES
jgi:uncharacterized protein